MKCGHDPYWTGMYGTCMVCRAEKAEESLGAALASVEAARRDALEEAAKMVGEFDCNDDAFLSATDNDNCLSSACWFIAAAIRSRTAPIGHEATPST